MAETNGQRLERLGMVDDETMFELSEGRRCEICNENFAKNLSPTNPCCEGRWCDDALKIWLEEKTEEEDYE